MELPLNDIVKKGYLKFKGKMGMWQRQWVLLKKPSSKGRLRMERYTDEKSSHKPNENYIDLHDVAYIQRLPADIKKFSLCITFRDSKKPTRSFCCESEAETCAWNVVLTELCLGQNAEAAIGVSSIDLLQSGPSQKELTEVFNVYLLPSLNLAFYGECMLQVTQEYIHLLESNNPGKRLATWPLNTLRRYGSDESQFTFESGRFCNTGEGLFIVTTKDGEAIYRKVHAAAIAIAEMHRLLHKQNMAHGVSVPVPSGRVQMPSPVHSIGFLPPNIQGPELPSRQCHSEPKATASGGEQPRLRLTSSAQNSPLPPIPRPLPTGEYLLCDDKAYPDDFEGPAEAPPHIVPGYLPMTGLRGIDEYVSLMNRDDSKLYLSLKTPEVTVQNTPNQKPHDDYTNQGAAAQSQRDYINKVYGEHKENIVVPKVPEATSAVRPGTQGGEYGEEIIYEEKGLTPAFRSFLMDRKQDD